MAADFFLEIDGIEGESTDDKLAKQIEITSWSGGASNSSKIDSATGGGGKERVDIQDMHFVAEMSAASPKLFLACAGGKHIPKATLTCRKAGEAQETYLTVELENVLISSYQTGASQHGDSYPTDQFSLKFGIIKWDYKAQKVDGGAVNKAKSGWDLTKNVKV